jgi:hypothetical protein
MADAMRIDEDDENMRTASDDELIAWVDDLESRCDYDVSTFRATVNEFCEVRAMVRLHDAGYTCEGEPLQADRVLIGMGAAKAWPFPNCGSARFDCYIDAAHTLLGAVK